MISITEFQRWYFWSNISLTPHWLEALANLWGCWSSRVHLFWYVRDQWWHGLQQTFHCMRCSWMSATSGCSNPQQSQRERVEQWVFWDWCLCSRYTYYQTGDGVVARRKSQWNKYFQNPRPGSRLTGGTSRCNNQRWGNVSIVSSTRFIMSECE